jgi:hypothetical protein
MIFHYFDKLMSNNITYVFDDQIDKRFHHWYTALEPNNIRSIRYYNSEMVCDNDYENTELVVYGNTAVELFEKLLEFHISGTGLEPYYCHRNHAVFKEKTNDEWWFTHIGKENGKICFQKLRSASDTINYRGNILANFDTSHPTTRLIKMILGSDWMK